MIRVVLDTNVFVSGVFWNGVPYQILKAWEEKKINLIFSPLILDEYIRVSELLAKKYIPRLDLTLILESVTIHGEMISPVFLDKPICCDPSDDKFIACALGANCNLIISGDKDLLGIAGYAGVVMLKPTDFFQRYLK